MYARIYEQMTQSDFDYSNNYQSKALSFINKTCHFCDSAFDLSNCDLEKRISNCNLTFSSYDIEAFYLIKCLQFILLTILHFLLCLMGVVKSILTIMVIRNKTIQKESKNFMCKHIQINSPFNVTYCLIMPL